MTTEEKAKAYDEALERTRIILNNSYHEETKTACKEIFPELRESEDERIRKEINTLYSDIDDCITELLKARTNKDSEAEGKALFKMEGLMVGTLQDLSCITDYLEKQKDKNRAQERYHRMAPIYNNKESFESALEKAWKYYNESASRTVDSFEDDYIECVFSKGFREGFLYKEKQKEQQPAEWSEEDEIMLGNIILCLKEYCLDKEIDWLEYLPERFNLETKREWSKKDQEILNIIIKYHLDQGEISKKHNEWASFLKSISERFNLESKQEWSKEDKEIIYSLRSFLIQAEQSGRYGSIQIAQIEQCLNWLKSLRPQQNFVPRTDDIVPLKVAIKILKERSDIKYVNVASKLKDLLNKLEHGNPVNWKPSEEQMEHLKRCFSHGKPHLPMPNQHVLESLYNDLQKLL